MKLVKQIYVSKTWDGIIESINIKKRNPSKINLVIIKGSTITNSLESTECFEKHFCNIAIEILSKIPLSNNNFCDCRNDPAENAFFINPNSKIAQIVFPQQSLKISENH